MERNKNQKTLNLGCEESGKYSQPFYFVSFSMFKMLENITNRIIKYYQPEKIILFGSCGKKTFRKGSDIDIFIIKETNKRPIERQMEVENILLDRLLPLDLLVYTPEEVRYLYSIGSPFISDVMEKGRLLYMRKATENWVKDAVGELNSATILYEHAIYKGSCYHSQQCVEKGLKALILEKGKNPQKIHDIVELLNKSVKLGFETELNMEDAVFLNSVYRGRYPTEEGLLPYGEPTREDAERAVSTAKSLIEKLTQIVGASIK